MAQWEIVHTPADLGRLLGVILGLPTLPAEEADLDAMRPLRAAVTRIAYGLALAAEPPPADDHLRAGAPDARGDRPHRLRSRGRHHTGSRRHRRGERGRGPPTARARAAARGRHHGRRTDGCGRTRPLARDAVDLFGGPLAHRIRICAADNRGLLFVDASQPGKRRWCSMERCGNRAKIRTHRVRHANGPAE